MGDCSRRSAGEPDLVIGEAGKQRTDFAQLAALIGSGLIENAELGFLIRDALRGLEIAEVQLPLGRDLVAIGQRFREMIAGFEKQHGDAGRLLDDHVHQRDALGLKAGGDAGERRPG